MSQKAASIAAGCWRLGIPVVVGPHGAKYRRMLLGRKENEDDWKVYNARDGREVYVGPRQTLFYAAETLEEAVVMISKLTMRPNDTNKGRAVKLTHLSICTKNITALYQMTLISMFGGLRTFPSR